MRDITGRYLLVLGLQVKPTDLPFSVMEGNMRFLSCVVLGNCLSKIRRGFLLDIHCCLFQGFSFYLFVNLSILLVDVLKVEHLIICGKRLLFLSFFCCDGLGGFLLPCALIFSSILWGCFCCCYVFYSAGILVVN